MYHSFFTSINKNLLNSKRTGSEEGPFLRMFDANTVITMLLKLEHAEGISKTCGYTVH